MAQKIKEVSVIEPIWRSIDNPLIIKQRKVIVQYEILINALWDKAAGGSLPAIKAIVQLIEKKHKLEKDIHDQKLKKISMKVSEYI